MATAVRSLALVTGAASGLGFELAKCCAENGFDLVVAAEEPEIQLAAQACRDLGAMVLAIQADLSSAEGVGRLWSELQGCGQPVEMLLLSAGHQMGGAFLDQEAAGVRHSLDSNLLGTLSLLHKVGGGMRGRGRGRILIAGPIAEIEPGTVKAVHDGTRAFLDTFSAALRAELKTSGVGVTCLMPEEGEHGDPAEIARRGFQAMMDDDDDPPAGWSGKLRAALSHATFDPAQSRHSH